MDPQEHWDCVYRSKAPDQVSWFRPHLEISLRWIERAAGGPGAALLDVGGGASTLVDDLIRHGFRNLTVLDVSQTAIDLAKARLAEAADAVVWLRADVTCADFPPRAYDVWHDRAVFHFLTSREDRQAYVRTAAPALKPGGHVIISTFGPEGPQRCSGLDAVRYDAKSLHAEFGAPFRLLDSLTEWHRTPSGGTQQFLYCDFAREE